MKLDEVKTHSILFFDDTQENFQGNNCNTILTILVNKGKPCSKVLLEEKYGVSVQHTVKDPMVYTGAGISVKTMKQLLLWESKGYLKHVRAFILDWDQCISQWAGLYGKDTLQMFQTWIQRGMPETMLWSSLFGSQERVQTLRTFLHTFQERCEIVTNQGDATGVKAVLHLLGYTIPAVGLKERKRVTKMNYIRTKYNVC